MTIQVNLGNRKRKELAGAVGGIFGATPSYKGPPSYHYEAGRAIIDKDGNITLNGKGRFDSSAMQRLMEGLREQGFDPRVIENTDPAFNTLADEEEEQSPQDEMSEEEAEETAAETDRNTVIRTPREGFDSAALDNIRLLVNSKALLIKKAMDVCDLTVRTTATAIEFPWFDRELSVQDKAAYTNFLGALCDMARRQKRVLSVEKPTDNDKFVFRLFLVRLGLIGDEYADTRRILLRNLTGNGSVKSVDGGKSNNRPYVERKPIETVPAEAMFPRASLLQKCYWMLEKLTLRLEGYFMGDMDDSDLFDDDDW